MRNSATCAGRGGERDLRCERDLAAIGDHDGAAVLGGVADDRHDHRGDEEVGEPRLLGEHLEQADEDLRHQRRGDRGDAENGQGQPERPRLDLLVARDVHRSVAAQREDRDDDVPHRSAIETGTETTARSWRSGSPSQPGEG